MAGAVAARAGVRERETERERVRMGIVREKVDNCAFCSKTFTRLGTLCVCVRARAPMALSARTRACVLVWLHWRDRTRRPAYRQQDILTSVCTTGRERVALPVEEQATG